MTEAERERESQEALERVARDSDTILGSSLGRVGRRVGDHFAAKDALAKDSDDAIEIWGRRIGRALSLLGVIVLAYLVGGQLRFW